MAKQNNSEYNVGVGVNVDKESINETTSVFQRLSNVFNNFIKNISKGWKTTESVSMQNDFSQENIVSSYLKDQIGTAQEEISRLEKLQEQYISDSSGSKNIKELNKLLFATGKSIREQEKVLKNATLELKHYDDKAKDSSEDNKNLAESFNLVSYTALGLFRRITKYGIKAFKTLTKSGSDYMETSARFNRIFGEGSKLAETYAYRVANAFGRNITEVKTSMTKVYTLLRNSNIEMKTAITLSGTLTAMANELASVWDTDVEQAINAIVSGLQGLPKAIKGYGVYLTENEIKNYLIEAGYASESLSGTLTQSQRVMGSYLKIMKDAGYAIGDFANTQKSVANQLRILQSSFNGITQTFGNMMNSVFAPLLNVINKVLIILNSVLNSLNKLPEPLKIFLGLLTGLIVLLPIAAGLYIILSYSSSIFKKQLEKLTDKTKEASGVNLVYNKTLLLIGKNWKSIIVTLVAVIAFIISLTNVISGFNKESEEISNNFNDANNSAKSLQKTLGGFDDVNIANFGNNDSNQLTTSEEMLKDISDEFEKLTQNTLGIKDLTAAVEDFNKAILYTSFAVIAFKALNIVLKLTHKGLENVGIVSATIVGAIMVVVGAIKAIVNAWNSDLPVWAKIMDTFYGIAAAIGAVIIAIGMLTHNWAKVAQGALITGLAAGGYGLTNLIATGGKSAVPQMATGGVVSKPVLATVGEGKYDEAVVPLGNSPQFANMKSDIAEAVVAGLRGSNVGNNPINIEIKVDEDYIYRAYNRQSRLYGGR